jgi:hypothetical protein
MGRKPATYADLKALPDHVVGEIIAGELYVSPRPALPHTGVSSALGVLLGGPLQFGRGGPGGWFILDEPELHFGLVGSECQTSRLRARGCQPCVAGRSQDALARGIWVQKEPDHWKEGQKLRGFMK